MKETARKYLKYVLFLIPLFLGTVGQCAEGEEILNAVFNSITMYGMNYGDDPANWMIQMARWTAPLATAGGILMVFRPLLQTIEAKLACLRGNVVAVYGGEALIPILKASGQYRVIEGGEKLLPAQRYLLFWEEKKNLDFYLQNKAAMDKREVYVRCSSLSAQETAGARLHLFCAEETGARLFWKQANMDTSYLSKGAPLSIALIGFGKLGEELLIWGLQNNIFSADQGFTYHVFGDGAHFSEIHQQLKMLNDRIVFHDSPWSAELQPLLSADRIIVCEQENQLTLIQELLLALPEVILDVLTDEPELLALIEAQDRIKSFDWKAAAAEPENLFDEKTLQRAKAINLRYAHLYSGVEETGKNSESEWEKLNAFTRYSNISAGDYHDIRLRMLARWGEGSGANTLSQAHLELLSELEHIRWCRYHFLNNWHYGEPLDGKAKDTRRRLHRDLVPYAKLSEEAKEKSRENIRVMMEIQ